MCFVKMGDLTKKRVEKKKKLTGVEKAKILAKLYKEVRKKYKDI